MDCNILCCTLVIFVALAATFADLPNKSCQHGIVTAGYTEPAGDIILEYGKPLEINCSIYSANEYNSSLLFFTGKGQEIDRKYLSIVSDTTLRLYIPKPEIQDATYTCKIKIDNKTSAVCLNKVVVGLKPQPVKNFSCISHNWNNLVCSWIPPDNNIKTNYNLSFTLKSLKVRHNCPNNTENILNSCTWDATSIPAYRQAHKDYKFILEATNALGSDSWVFPISNFEVVVPDPPRNLSVINTNVNSITINWSLPIGVENLPPGLIHKVEYRNAYQDWEEVDTSSLCVSHCPTGYTLKLSDLKFAHTKYEIRVRCRSGKRGTKWSEPSYIAPFTRPTIPEAPPRTDIGSFEISSTNSHSLRNVFLYWQEIPKFSENGDFFKYKILSVEEDGQVKDIQPDEVGSFFASFRDLTSKPYHFKIVSENSEGVSNNYSEILVPSGHSIPPVPEQVVQIPFNSDTYQISWKEPIYRNKIDNYTVFWCKNKSDRPYQCSGDLEWTIVQSSLNAKNISNLTDSQVYQVGVSANSAGLSSGIVWASCTVLPGRGGGKMRSISLIRSGSTFIYFSWKLDCSNQIGVVSGFHIEYCALNTSCKPPSCQPSENCLDSSGIDVGDDKTTYNITDLKPNTVYSVFISVKSDKLKGVRSEPLLVQTDEGVPDAIETLDVTNVSNTSITMNWSPPENSNGILINYLIRWKDQSKNIGVNENYGYILNGLESFKEYNITVSGCTLAGCGKPSRAESIITKIGCPGPPLQLKYRNSSRIPTWSHPSGYAGNQTYYTVKFSILSDGIEKERFEENTSLPTFVLPWDKCEADGVATSALSVRAANILEDNTVLEGPWSEVLEDACFIAPPPPHLTVVIPLVAVLLSIVLCIFCALFSQHLWVKFNRMRDISVKLPARLGPRQEDKSDNHAIHMWNNHIVREEENIHYRPSPDEQSLLKVKEEIELIQEDISIDRETLGCDILQNNELHGVSPIPVVAASLEPVPSSSPSTGYIKVAPPQQSSGYVTIPPTGYMMATLPPSPIAVSPSVPQSQCSIMSLKQNGLNSFNPKPFNSFPESNHFGDNNMISPINST